MKTSKPLTTKRKLVIFGSTIVVVGVLAAVFSMMDLTDPTWKYVQEFENGNLLTSVEKTSKTYKNTKEDFFLIHIYDFNKKDYRDVMKVQIDEGMESQSEYIGYSHKYIWLKTPEWKAIDITTATPTIVDFASIKKKICAKNPSKFKDIIELAKVENYLKATNQEGDQYFVNLETFATTQTAPVPYYEVYHKEYSLLDQAPQLLPGSELNNDFNCSFSDGKTEYLIKSIDDYNSVKRSIFSTPAIEEKIELTATDTTQVAIVSGDQVSTVSQAVEKVYRRLTNTSYINAVGLGVIQSKFVFRYQKTVDPNASWHLAWFDLKTNKIVKEISLEKEGLKAKNPGSLFSHCVSVDGKWGYFMYEKGVPVRVKL